MQTALENRIRTGDPAPSSQRGKEVPDPPLHRFHPPHKVVAQLLSGKTLLRALFNLSLRDVEVKGRVLDIGSKNKSGSYYRNLRIAPGTEFTHTDIEPGEGLVYLDVEKPFPLADGEWDGVMSFHLFEHVYRFQTPAKETYRILKRGGRAVVAVPFIHEYHADPDDYFRFTDSGIRRTWEEAGFRCSRIEAVGEGLLTTCFTKLASLLVPGPLKASACAVAYLLATPFDRLIALRRPVKGRTIPQRFAMDYLAVFEKP